MTAYSFLNVGVSSLDEAEKLWRGVMGMEVADLGHWDISALEALWDLAPGAVRRSRLLCTPGAPAGLVHLVEFATEGPTIREDAKATDLCPKNLDVNVKDLPRRLEEIEQAGYQRLSDPVEYPIGDLQVREVQVPVHDGVNLVLAEIMGEAFASTEKGYGGATSVVTTTTNIEREVEFLSLLGLARLDHHLLEGPAVEQMVGLPAGAKLEMQLLGEAEHRYGRAELVCYHGVTGRDLYSRCGPPARGLFRAAIWVDDCASLLSRVHEAGYTASFRSLAAREEFLAAGSVISPDGWTIDLLEKQPRSEAEAKNLQVKLAKLSKPRYKTTYS